MNPRSSDSPLSSSTSSDPKLVCPEEIHFPFQPYPIQISFMRDLFFTIENRKIGLFESPTGTVSETKTISFDGMAFFSQTYGGIFFAGKIHEHYLWSINMAEGTSTGNCVATTKHIEGRVCASTTKILIN